MSKKTPKKQLLDEVDPILGRRRAQPTADPRAEAKSSGVYVGVIGAPPIVDPGELPPEERPGVTTIWIPFPGSNRISSPGGQ
jgi:hypothetical protein